MPAVQPPLAHPAPPLATAPLRHLRILLIEGMELMRHTITLCLERLGQPHVTCSDTGPKGLLAALSNNYDSILCDLRPPGMDALTLYTHLLDRKPHQAQRLILLVSGATTATEDQFLAHTELPFLAKPFRPADLATALQRTQPDHEPQL